MVEKPTSIFAKNVKNRKKARGVAKLRGCIGSRSLSRGTTKFGSKRLLALEFLSYDSSFSRYSGPKPNLGFADSTRSEVEFDKFAEQNLFRMVSSTNRARILACTAILKISCYYRVAIPYCSVVKREKWKETGSEKRPNFQNSRTSRRLCGIARAYHSEQLWFSDFAEFDLRSGRIGDLANPEFRFRSRYLENGDS